MSGTLLSRRWVVLIAVAIITLGALFPVPSEARTATGGVGRFLNSINWIEWMDDTPGAAPPGRTISPSGETRTETRIIGAFQVHNTCTISQPDSGTGYGGARREMRVYRPGSYRQDGLDDLYNIGGAGRANRMSSGLSNTTPGALVRFKISCASRIEGPGLPSGGMAVPLDGLVFADAESSNRAGARVGSVQAEAAPATDWYIIDRHRDSNCTQHTIAVLEAARGVERLRLEPSNSACASGPMAVGFMKIPPQNGVTSAVISVQGEGTSAVAIGVVQNFDFGDAPASYGTAAALYQPTWSGPALTRGSTNAFTTSMAEMAAPPIMLGSSITPDLAPSQNPDGGDDGFEQHNPRPVTPGLPVVENVLCAGTGFVRGWIDWNSNGTFDAGEASDIASCSGGKIDLRWTVPDDAVSAYEGNSRPGGPATSHLRLRAAATAQELTSPVGFTATGEVEDHPYALMLAELRVGKSSDALEGQKFSGDVVTYRVEGTNISFDPFVDSYKAHVFDDLSGVIDDADFLAGSLTTTVDGGRATDPAQYDPATRIISWHGTLPARGAVVITYQMRLRHDGDRRLGNIAWGQHGGTGDPQAGVDCMPRSASGWDEDAEVPCAREDHRLMSLVKNVQSQYDDEPDSADSWNLTATGDFGGETNDTTRTVPGATAVGARNTFIIPATGGFTFSEQAVPGKGVGYRLSATQWDENTGVVTYTNVDSPAGVTWSKTDPVTGVVLGGSRWRLTGGRDQQVLEIEDCVGPSPSSCLNHDLDHREGYFQLGSVAWGRHELVETTAPQGYRPLTVPRQVTLTADAAVGPLDLGPITNERLPGSLVWRKIDADTGEPLAGAHFELRGLGGQTHGVEDCVADDASACAGSDKDPSAGGFRVDGLAWGTWNLRETRAPLGYLVSTREESVDIDAAHLNHTIDAAFSNMKAPVPVLPLTGGTAADTYLIGGGIFLGIAAALLTSRWRGFPRRSSHTVKGKP